MKKIIIVAIVIICLITGISTLIFINSKISLRHYFDNWKSESTEDIVHVLYQGCVCYNSKKLELRNIISGIEGEAFCVRNGRIYFCYFQRIKDSNLHELWKIASVDINGKDLKDHFSGDLFSSTDDIKDYEKLSYRSNRNEYYGGFYENGLIYLRGYDKTIVYDIDNDRIKETVELPISKYTWSIDNYQKLIIEDTERDLTRTLTLDVMAKKNEYAKKLLELSEKKKYDGKSFLEKFFVGVKLVNDDVYIIGQVLNWHGEAFAVVFKYDFSSDSVQYVSSIMVNDSVTSDYYFASSK